MACHSRLSTLSHLSNLPPFPECLVAKLTDAMAALRFRVVRAGAALQERQVVPRCPLGFPLTNDFLTVAAEEVVDGFYPDLNRARRFVLVEILETKIRCPRLLNNSLDDPIDGRIVTAFKTGNLQRD